jgi:hypothetical protein
MTTKAKSVVSLKTVLKHVTTDGKEFTDKAEAQKHEISLLRIAALDARRESIDLEGFVTGGDLSSELSNQYAYLAVGEGDAEVGIRPDFDTLFKFIANNADLLLNALMVKKPGGRKPKVAVPIRRRASRVPTTSKAEEPFAL